MDRSLLLNNNWCWLIYRSSNDFGNNILNWNFLNWGSWVRFWEHIIYNFWKCRKNLSCPNILRK